MEVVLNALGPETDSQSNERSSVELHPTIDGVRISVEASDTTALRAALNSYLHWVEGILRMFQNLEP